MILFQKNKDEAFWVPKSVIVDTGNELFIDVKETFNITFMDQSTRKKIGDFPAGETFNE